ncbi:MAG: pseudouridine synthase [Cyclobacteriaceae bacterium]|nr:pseudouridine synthase [Cyclobacteriaceae bacterium]
MKLDILYKDNYMVAINKPHGLLVHRSSIAKDASEFAMQMLRDQINEHVYTIHRLDRKTGGVLLFALNEYTHKAMQKQFAENKIKKIYKAIVRGYTEHEGEIDYPLKREDGKIQEAYTAYKTLQQTEINISSGNHNTSRYSFVEVYPQTGRMHQIRKHFAHILHPIIADRPHGCNKQNKMFKEKFNMQTMLLHAASVNFIHPDTGENIIIKTGIQSEFMRMIHELEFDTSTITNQEGE